jgi:hypothetical protein
MNVVVFGPNSVKKYQGEPEDLDAPPSRLVQQQDRHDVPPDGENGEDAQLDQRVIQQRGVRGDHCVFISATTMPMTNKS